MKSKITSKKNACLLIGVCFVITLVQCSKSEFMEKEYDPVVPLFDYSSVACIARITDNSENWSLCRMEASGNDFQKIVELTVSCQKPVCSHSGTQLVFTATQWNSWFDEYNAFQINAQYGLYVTNINGTGYKLIEHIDDKNDGRFGCVAWSPDDKQIIYVRSYDSHLNKNYLILYNIPDNTETIIPTEGNVCNLSFSPDGKQIVYCTTIETDGMVYIHSFYNHHIYKMDANGKNNQLIIQNAGSPKWSPHGDKIVYLTIGKNGSSQIAVADADGSNQKQLTSSVSPNWLDTGFPRGGNSDPQWTPDGKRIVYVSEENDNTEIFIMNVDGRKKTRLTKAAYGDDSPEITPDGKHILFHSRKSALMVGGINIMELDGSNQQVISNVGIYPIACR